MNWIFLGCSYLIALGFAFSIGGLVWLLHPVVGFVIGILVFVSAIGALADG